MKHLLDEKSKQIKLLEQENSEVIEKLKKRETDLYKYKFKIKDLRKSQHVLTHRTSEMRESLKPKELQIEKLKSQQMNLEEVVEKQFSEITEETEKMSKLKSKVKQVEGEIARALKERAEKE